MTLDSREQAVRLVVMTDIGGDPDDQQSLVRLLLYSNAFEIEGLIATAPVGTSRIGDWDATIHTELIEEEVRAFGQVCPNLLRHESGYPSEDRLLSLVKRGLPNEIGGTIRERSRPEAVWAQLGDGRDTEGSDWLISVVDKPDPRPVWMTIWGGARELAQAIWRVSQDRGPDELQEFKSRLRVYAIHDQDNTGEWLESAHPDIFWLRNGRPHEPHEHQMFRGMYQLGDESLMSRAWLEEHVRTGHGPLGALYPPETWSPPNDAMKEGDTPTWFYLLPLGLGDPMEPTWGGWGGRFEKGPVRYEDAQDALWGITNERVCIARWRPHWQADFQARMDWCVKGPDEANHPPVPAIEGPTRCLVSPGEKVFLNAAGSHDPDGDSLSFDWCFYRDASSYQGPLPIANHDSQQASFVAPDVAEPVTVHIVLTVTDDGVPPLSRYQRVIVAVDP